MSNLDSVYIVKMFKKLLLLVLFVMVIFGLLFYYVVDMSGKSVFCDSYQSVIQRKYEKLRNTDEKKIIIIGGSSSAFGIKEEYLENLTGYKVVNLGLHAGFGISYNMEIAKANINEGDIVILALEYGWHLKGSLDIMKVDLVLSGIDGNISMYKHIPVRKWREVISYLDDLAFKKYTYLNKKNNYFLSPYKSTAFDKNGDLSIYRNESLLMDYSTNGKSSSLLDLGEIEITREVITYFLNYKRYVEKNNAVIYFTVPPVLDEAIINDLSDFYYLIDLEEREIGIKFISKPENYFFDKSLMYDTIYHCNDLGATIRTQKLAQDIYDIDYSNLD